MASCFFCGTSVIPHEEEYDDYERTHSPASSPRKSRPSKSNNNPYSSRGLDQFSALLSEIEHKRQQIYSQLDPHEISLVRFVCTDGHEFKPIVVKAKQRPPKPDTTEKLPTENDTTKNRQMTTVKCNRRRLNPKFYLVVILVMILMALVLFGRSVAIMCASIGWYIVPTFAHTSNYSCSSLRTSFKYKKLVDDKLVSVEGTKSFKKHHERQYVEDHKKA
ncbi:hypothetical protein vseg_016521 [Gypsophila vaccaria]